VRRPAEVAALAAIAGVAAYVAIDVALVYLRPHFSVLHNAESDYGSTGPYAWVMDLNFVLRGVLSVLVAWALAHTVDAQRRLRAGLRFLLVWAAGSVLLAFFPDDPVGTKTHGLARVHVVVALIAFTAVVLGTRIVSRAVLVDAGWRRVAVPLNVLSWGALVPIVLLGRARLRPESLGGLYEKIFLAVELTWFALAAAWIVRCSRSPTLNAPPVAVELGAGG
jgi:hypothetical membrane protein